MRILISGGTGFIGSRLVNSLIKDRHELIVLHQSKIDGAKKNKNILFIQTDILKNLPKIHELPEFDTIINIAGLSGGREEEKYTQNTDITKNMLSLVNKNVKKFIHISSQAVYGNPNALDIKEDFPLDPGFSLYSSSKVDSENCIKNFQKNNEGIYFALRFCGFVEGGGLIDYIKNQAFKNLPIKLFSKGKIFRDYISIDDGIRSIYSCIINNYNDNFIPINIGSGQKNNAKDIALYICKNINSSSKIEYSSDNPTLGNLTLNIKKAKSLLNYCPNDFFDSIDNYIFKNKLEHKII